MVLYTTTAADRTLYRGDDLEAAVAAAHEWMGEGRRIPNVKIRALEQAPTFVTFDYGEDPDETIRIEASYADDLDDLDE